MLSDADDAALYDRQNPWDPGRSPGDRFYHELALYGDWDRAPVTTASREIIVVARA